MDDDVAILKRKVIEHVRAKRKAAGLSQVELASYAGVSYGSLKRFARFGEISMSSLMRIAKALHCAEDFNHLFTEHASQDPSCGNDLDNRSDYFVPRQDNTSEGFSLWK